MKTPRTTLAMAVAAVSLTVALTTIAGADPAEQITDVAGDAHGLMQPYHDGGAYGNLTEILATNCEVFAGPDCTGDGTPIEPLSYDEADILGARVSTMVDAVPVGDDGIDYRATGVRFDIRTAAVPRVAGATVYVQVLSLLPDDSCIANAMAVIPGSGAPTGYVNLHTGALNDPCEGNLAAHTDLDSSRVQVTTNPPGVSIALPYSLFSSQILHFLGQGTSIVEPWVHARIYDEDDPTVAPVGQMGSLDKSPKYPYFDVGEDMPRDVACTRNCP